MADKEASSEQERSVILHVSLPGAIMLRDYMSDNDVDAEEGGPVEKRSTEKILMDMLCDMAWGEVDLDSNQWVLTINEPRPPAEMEDSEYISYNEYICKRYPLDNPELEAENLQKHDSLKAVFTQKNQAGHKLKSYYDQLVKCVSLPLPVRKAYGIERVNLDDSKAMGNMGVGSDGDAAGFELIKKGKWNILPSFFNMLITFVKAKKNFSVVIQDFGFNEDHLKKEFNMFCSNTHPCFNGTNRTKKTNLDGSKNNPDLRITDTFSGNFDRNTMTLLFEHRDATKSPLILPEGSAEGDDSAPVGDSSNATPEPAFEETKYSGVQDIFAGLSKEVCVESSTVLIRQDIKWWLEQGCPADQGPLLPIGLDAEHSVMHLYIAACPRFFAYNQSLPATSSVEIIDAVSEKRISRSDGVSWGCFLEVDLYEAIIDPEYFIKAVSVCETAFEKELSQRRIRHGIAEGASEEEKRRTYLGDLSAGQYLVEAGILASLLPGLELCEKLRPDDPLRFLANHLLLGHSSACKYTKMIDTSPLPPSQEEAVATEGTPEQQQQPPAAVS